jgi:hypothetical protein
MKIYEKAYFNLKIIFFVLYFISFFGIWSKSPYYLGIMQDIITIFTGCVIIFLFNPWFNNSMTLFHKKIAFDAGILILFSSSLKNIAMFYSMKNQIKLIPFIGKVALI